MSCNIYSISTAVVTKLLAWNKVSWHSDCSSFPVVSPLAPVTICLIVCIVSVFVDAAFTLIPVYLRVSKVKVCSHDCFVS